MSNGWEMPDNRDFRMLRKAGLMGYRGLGQIENWETYPYSGVVADTGADTTSFFESVGDVFGNVIRTLGQQVPAMLGQPVPQVYQAPGMPQPTGGIQSMLSNPIVLIGLGVGAYFLLAKPSRARRNPRRRRRY
jgi:hypothetical protein